MNDYKTFVILFATFIVLFVMTFVTMLFIYIFHKNNDRRRIKQGAYIFLKTFGNEFVKGIDEYEKNGYSIPMIFIPKIKMKRVEDILNGEKNGKQN